MLGLDVSSLSQEESAEIWRGFLSTMDTAQVDYPDELPKFTAFMYECFRRNENVTEDVLTKTLGALEDCLLLTDDEKARTKHYVETIGRHIAEYATLSDDDLQERDCEFDQMFAMQAINNGFGSNLPK